MTLCTVADVEAITQAGIEDTDPKILNLLDMATELITSEVGRAVEAEAHVGVIVTPTYRQGDILLPHWPLASIDKVVEDTIELTADTQFHSDLELGIISRLIGTTPMPAYWASGVRSVVVDYTTKTPPGLRTLAAGVVARAFKAGTAWAGQPDETLGMKQLSVGAWSATTTEAAADPDIGGVILTESELEAVQAWRDR